jgi:hypothetical protein
MKERIRMKRRDTENAETEWFQNGKNTPTPRQFSYPSASLGTSEWQAKDLQATELGRLYGEWEVGREDVGMSRQAPG